MAVAIRASCRPGSDPEAVSLATTAGALLVCLVLAAPFLGGLTWHGVWPFLVAGLVAPGLSQVLFVRAIEAVGASRTAILVGVSPFLSALFAISLLGEPVRTGLVLGTVAIVGGAVALVSTRSAATRLTAAGATAGVLAASLISARDNFVRWADTGNAVPGVVAAAGCLVSATMLIAAILLIRRRPLMPLSLRPALRPLAAAALLFGLAYGAVFVPSTTAVSRWWPRSTRPSRCGRSSGRRSSSSAPKAWGRGSSSPRGSWSPGASSSARRGSAHDRSGTLEPIYRARPSWRAGSSSRRKRRKKNAKTAKKTTACSEAIVIPASCWSVAAESPQRRSGACSYTS